MASSPTTTMLADLPVDILQIICRKLSFIKDFVVFDVVCTLWRSVLFQCRRDIVLPVLMFPQKYSHDIPIFGFPDLSKHVLYNTKEFSYSYGSSHEWLLIRTTPSTDNALELLNPFASVNNLIQLPFKNIYPWRVALSHDPLKTSNYVVVIIDFSAKLFFYKAGDTSWTLVAYHAYVVAITYYRDRIYASDCFGNLISCDINSIPLSVKKVASIEPCHIMNDSHLLELAGDLLYVYGSYDRQREKNEFQVFKVEPKEVLELNNLRGHAIFLSYKSSVAVLASDFPNCKRDHIYFSTLGFSGSFNLMDKSSHSLQLPEFAALPVWIQPTLNMTKLDDH